MWDWYEYYIDSEGDTQYSRCKICNKFPALVLTYQDDNEYPEGPLCKFHWILEINRKFQELEKKLDNENWGGSPETRREICTKCGKNCPNGLGMAGINIVSKGKTYDFCWDCYDKEKV